MSLQSDAITFYEEELNFMKVCSFLISEDVKKFYFLLMDSLPKLTPCPQIAKELFILLRTTPAETYSLLKELLFYTKKYKLLRFLGTCHHQMKTNLKNGSGVINSGRLLLFNLCEDLKDSDVETLKTLLGKTEVPHNPEWDNIAAEEFFSIWLRDIIKEKIMHLQNALPNMNYKNINTFEEGFRYYFEKPFPIKLPSVGNPCGLAVIFNFEKFNAMPETLEKLHLREIHLETRTGTNMDEKMLIDLWHEYGFDVLVFQDLSSVAMLEVIKIFREFHYNNYDVFVSCILSHGGKDGMIYASDNIPLDLYGDIAYNVCTKALLEKPKLFFVQACRENLDINENIPPEDNDSLASDSPNAGVYVLDRYLMFLMSVIPLKLAMSQNRQGSWLVSELKNVFERSNVAARDLRKLVNRAIFHITERPGGTVGPVPELRTTVMRPLYLKRLENPHPIQKLSSINVENCQSLFQLITTFPVQPDVYLV